MEKLPITKANDNRREQGDGSTKLKNLEIVILSDSSEDGNLNDSIQQNVQKEVVPRKDKNSSTRQSVGSCAELAIALDSSDDDVVSVRTSQHNPLLRQTNKMGEIQGLKYEDSDDVKSCSAPRIKNESSIRNKSSLSSGDSSILAGKNPSSPSSTSNLRCADASSVPDNAKNNLSSKKRPRPETDSSDDELLVIESRRTSKNVVDLRGTSSKNAVLIDCVDSSSDEGLPPTRGLFEKINSPIRWKAQNFIKEEEQTNDWQVDDSSDEDDVQPQHVPPTKPPPLRDIPTPRKKLAAKKSASIKLSARKSVPAVIAPVSQKESSTSQTSQHHHQHPLQRQASTTDTGEGYKSMRKTIHQSQGTEGRSALEQHDPHIFMKALARGKKLDVRDWRGVSMDSRIGRDGMSTSQTQNSRRQLFREGSSQKETQQHATSQLQMRSDKVRTSEDPRNKSKPKDQLKTPPPPSRRKRKREAKSRVTSWTEPSLADLGVRTETDADQGDDAASQMASHISDLRSMTLINHMSSVTSDELTGLPSFKFSVYGFPDDVIYSFRLDVRKSNIPNSGLGAFLTYLGARELRSEQKLRSHWLLESRPYKMPKTTGPLTALHPSGFGMAISLAGENLHCPFNCNHLLQPLHALMPGKRRMKVRLANIHDFYYDDELEGLDEAKNQKKIGFLGIHNESDYIPTNRKFSSHFVRCGLINLGKYGPFTRFDRKTEFQFDVKTFIFCHEPSEWCFGVEEKLRGHEQIIDITDDFTGEPRDVARRNIPMYINETGHNKDYVQNVHACEKDDRSVHYFLKIDKPMKEGDTVEALVDYLGVYEEIRERKGYGRRNIECGLKSDEHLPTLLERNFGVREHVEAMIGDLSAGELFYMLEWIHEIRIKLLQATDEFIYQTRLAAFDYSSSPSTVATAKQFVALRRLEWLGSRFGSRFERLQEGYEYMFSWYAIRDQTYKWLEMLQWDSCSDFMNLVARHPDLTDRTGTRLEVLFEREIVEEVCYEVKDVIERPLNESVWCSEGRRLTISLSQTIAKHFWRRERTRLVRHEQLLAEFIDLGVCAAKRIREGTRDNLCEPILDMDDPATKDDPFNSLNPSVPRESENYVSHKNQNYEAANGRGNGSKELHQKDHIDNALFLASCETALSIIARATEGLNETSHLLWQVVYIVHSFVNRFLCPSEYSADYSLSLLCSKVGVDVDAVVKAGMKRCKSKIRKEGINYNKKKSKKNTDLKARHKVRNKQKVQKKQTAPSKQRDQNKQTVQDKPKLLTFNAAVFWGVVWVCLTKKLKWTLDVGTRPRDFYFLPPGVSRGMGFRNRVDYFDSISLVMSFIKTNSRYKDLPEIKKCLDLYYKCTDLMAQLRKIRKLPKFSSNEELIKFLKEHVNVS